MKILDAPSQILNVINTTSQRHRHRLRQKYEYNVRQKYIVYAKQKHQVRQTKHQVRQTKHIVRQPKYQVRQIKAKYTKQNTKYAKQIYAVLSREIFVANLRTFWRTFYRPKKYGGVPKMTIIRYDFRCSATQ